jgi:ferredoxin
MSGQLAGFWFRRWLQAPGGWSIEEIQGHEPMKIIVDFDVCQSHGLCTQSAPEVFEIRDDGFLYILNEAPPDSLRTKVERAIQECPTGAIKVEG